MKKFLLISYILTILIFSNGCVFPDKLPDWKDLNQYTLEKFKFQQTSVNEFKSMCPEIEPYDFGNDIIIFTVEPQTIDKFSEINVGFRHKTFDWIEFILDKQVEANEFTALYGPPEYIDTKYSETLDYYNYDSFSIAVDKKNLFARSISIFAPSESTVKNKFENKWEENGKQRFFEVFPDLKPGITPERQFSGKYPELLPYMEGEFDLNLVYTLVEELGGAAHYYQRAVLRFENGLLVWIYLIPEAEEAGKIVNRIEETPKIEKLDDRFDFYIYDNFVLTVDRETKRVNNIGLVGFDRRF